MSNDSQISNTRLFVAYAGGNMESWQKAVGQRVVHTSLGRGIVLEANSYLVVRFNQDIKKF